MTEITSKTVAPDIAARNAAYVAEAKRLRDAAMTDTFGRISGGLKHWVQAAVGFVNPTSRPYENSYYFRY